MSQLCSRVAMVRPHHFRSNEQTAADNRFQQLDDGRVEAAVSRYAREEFDAMVAQLNQQGVRVEVFDDTTTDTPDSVFPNNWFTSHADGTLVLYPMHCANRRLERRVDIIQSLEQNYVITRTVDLTGFESQGLSLEGTGALVFDPLSHDVYAVRSQRMSDVVLAELSKHIDCNPVVIDAHDREGVPIYHTNVLMNVGEHIAMYAPELVAPAYRDDLAQRLAYGDRCVIELTGSQIESFAGNALELVGREGPILVLSQTAAKALTRQQRDQIEQKARMLICNLPTIEQGGGSARCMIAQLQWQPR